MPFYFSATIGLPWDVHGSVSTLQHAAAQKDGGMSPLYHHHILVFLAMGPLRYRQRLALHPKLGVLVVLLHSDL